MTEEQRAEWDAEFGKPEFPYLFYLRDNELSAESFEAFKTLHREKRDFWNDKFDEILYNHLTKD